jgi:hypothetical protein
MHQCALYNPKYGTTNLMLNNYQSIKIPHNLFQFLLFNWVKIMSTNQCLENITIRNIIYPDYIGVKYRKYRISQAHKDHIIIMTGAIHGAYES